MKIMNFVPLVFYLMLLIRGGTTTVELPVDHKLFDVTWKKDNLWYATRPMRADETPETYTFKEDSSFGIFEGTVIFVER